MNTTITTESERKTILLSKKGMKELRRAISQLEVEQHGIMKELRESDKTSGHDDRFERNERLARLETVQAELVEKQQTLTHAQLIPSKRARAKVALGSVVDLIDQQGRLFRYTLVNSIEANPSDGRISVVSPLGSTLLGKTVEDAVEWSANQRHQSFRLVRVS